MKIIGEKISGARKAEAAPIASRDTRAYRSGLLRPLKPEA
jgi:hypothetical protein